ncbi:glycosyltransferase [Bizionia sediminis]|uniref:Glycosyltransferase n=1 Tax=Bizionia sediminis TaxID=1737064 RepID=A0ABW5KV71_9FLAO
MLLLEVLYYIFIVVFCFQLGYYLLIFGQFTRIKLAANVTNNLPPVSVIICAKNEAENLKTFLPSIIAQQYPVFELVLINDASYDHTWDVMENFSEQHPNVKLVNVKNTEAFWANKKYALTLGIKAATYNHLLFTDADCQPISENWILEMAGHFSAQKSIVLGYGAYQKIKGSLLNKLIRFETLFTALQYLSFAKIGMPYMGVGRNLAYTKEDFFRVSGFMKHMHIRSGDDDLFINEIANKHNTSLCISENSITVSVPKKTFSDWVKQKRRHITTAQHYKAGHKVLLALFYISQVCFWLLAILLLSFLVHWQLVLSAILLRFACQYLIIWHTAKKLKENDLVLLAPFFELFLVIFQFIIFTTNILSKPKHWK